MEKPFAPSCERNQQVILDVLKNIIHPTHKHLLEIGSGTGQHAVYMAPHFHHLQWHTSDLTANHAGIKMWLQEQHSKNISEPIEYESGKSDFPDIDIDIVLTANTLHIMSWQNAQTLLTQLGTHLKAGAQIIIYGPFKYDGKFTSESNAEFDLWLKQQEPHRGIRDIEAIIDLMSSFAITLIEDKAMPANNRILHFVKNQIK